MRPLPGPTVCVGGNGEFLAGTGEVGSFQLGTLLLVCASALSFTFFSLGGRNPQVFHLLGFFLTQKYFCLPAVVRGDRGLSCAGSEEHNERVLCS